MWADGVEAYSAVEVGESTEVADEPSGNIVRCVVNPILFTVKIGVAVVPMGFSISGSQFSVELPPSLLSRRILL